MQILSTSLSQYKMVSKEKEIPDRASKKKQTKKKEIQF